MNVNQFSQVSGFKVLAIAKLTACEYSAALYLINAAASGLDDFVTNESELASIIGYSEHEIHSALMNLAESRIIRLNYFGNNHGADKHSLRIGFCFNIEKWNIGEDNDGSSDDAIVYPFLRDSGVKLAVLDGEKSETEKDRQHETWRRIYNAYLQGRSHEEEDLEMVQNAAKILTETHPVDQVLLFIRHFGLRIPSLSLLASSWQHYQELFGEEHQKVDLLGARQKHQEMDGLLRERSQNWLDDAERHGLSEEEIGILNILVKHRHPRRQLFWAYQVKNRYQNLHDFFEENHGLMIAVTSSGTVVKKPFRNS